MERIGKLDRDIKYCMDNRRGSKPIKPYDYGGSVNFEEMYSQIGNMSNYFILDMMNFKILAKFWFLILQSWNFRQIQLSLPENIGENSNPSRKTINSPRKTPSPPWTIRLPKILQQSNARKSQRTSLQTLPPHLDLLSPQNHLFQQTWHRHRLSQYLPWQLSPLLLADHPECDPSEEENRVSVILRLWKDRSERLQAPAQVQQPRWDPNLRRKLHRHRHFLPSVPECVFDVPKRPARPIPTGGWKADRKTE